VSFPYGGWNLEAMNAHGGWLFSARDLVRLLLAVDGSPTRPDLLLPSTIDTMSTSDEPNRRYAKGWIVNKDRTTWWHTGSLDGSASCVVRTASGYTWAILLNSRATSNRFWHDLEELGWTCVKGTTEWPAYDLFQPEQNAANLRMKPAGTDGVTFSWRNGNGSARLLVLQEQTAITALPQDGTNYVADAFFGHGATLGHGAVVAASSDSSVTVRNLKPGKTYFARVVEYHQNELTGQYPVYALDGNPTLQFALPQAPLFARHPKASKPAVASAGKPRKKRLSPTTAQPAPRPSMPQLPLSNEGRTNTGRPTNPNTPAIEPQGSTYWLRLREMSRGLLSWFGA
jgi:hypothetical protein